MPYLPKGCRPDFNNGPGGDSNSGPVLPPPQRLFEFDSNNGSLVSDRVYICSGLIPIVSWRVPYLPKGCRPAFNNGLEGDSNSGSVPPGVYLSPTRIMAPPQAIPILGQMEDTPVQVFYLWIPGGCHICPRAVGLTSIMALKVTRIVAPFPPGVYLSPTRIMDPPQATPILCQMKSI